MKIWKNKNKMSENQQETIIPETPEQTAAKELLQKIDLANECSVIMTLLCEKMGLSPKATTQAVFVSRFTEIQQESLDAQKQLSKQYMNVAAVGKQKKPRMKRKP